MDFQQVHLGVGRVHAWCDSFYTSMSHSTNHRATIGRPLRGILSTHSSGISIFVSKGSAYSFWGTRTYYTSITNKPWKCCTMAARCVPRIHLASCTPVVIPTIAIISKCLWLNCIWRIHTSIPPIEDICTPRSNFNRIVSVWSSAWCAVTTKPRVFGLL